MNRRKFLFGSVVAVAAAPLLAKLPPAPSFTFPNHPVIPRYGVLRGGVWDSRRRSTLVELNEVWMERALRQMAENAADAKDRIVYDVLTYRRTT